MSYYVMYLSEVKTGQSDRSKKTDKKDEKPKKEDDFDVQKHIDKLVW